MVFVPGAQKIWVAQALCAAGGCGVQPEDLVNRLLDHFLDPSSFAESWD